MPFEVRAIDSPSPPLIATPERWIVVAALAVLLAVCHGLITSGLTIFDRSIITDLGISRGELKLRDVFQVATGGFWALGIGIVADRIGPTRIIYAGLVVFAVALLAYGSVTGVGEIYALHVVLAFSYASCHTVVVVLILTRLFNIGIGPALGVVLAGESLGGTIFPQILVRLIEAEGWRPAMRTLAVLPVLMLAVMPWVLRWVPERRLAAATTTEAATCCSMPPGRRCITPEAGSSRTPSSTSRIEASPRRRQPPA
jgi:MFS family permease